MGQGIGSGFKTVGQGIGGGVKKILPGEKPDLLRTPGFVPEGAKAAGDVGGGGILPSIARPDAAMPLRTPDVGGRGILPISPTPFAVEQSNAPITPMLPRPTPPAMAAPTQGIVPTAPQMPGQMPSAREVAPPMDMDRRNVMLPALPGESGPKDYSRTEAARYDYHRSRMKQPGEEGYDGTGQYKRSGKDILRNALMGFFQGAASDPRNPLAAGLGGAMVGGVGSTVSPQGSAEYGFNTVERPRVEQQVADQDAEIKREQAIQRAKWAGKMDEAKLLESQVDTEYRRAQTDATRAGMKDGALIRRKQEADIAATEALAESRRTGRPTKTLIQGDDGAVREVLVYPDGTRVEVGKSGQAAMLDKRMDTWGQISDERNRSAIERARMQQEGAMSRTQVQQDGAMERAQMRGDDGGTKPKEAQAYLLKFNDLKQELIKAEGMLSDPNVQANPAMYKNFEAQAAALKAQLGDMAQFAQDNYGDALEGGPGQGGYAYVKPRSGGLKPKLPQPQSGGSQGTTRPRSQFNSQKFPGLKFD